MSGPRSLVAITAIALAAAAVGAAQAQTPPRVVSPADTAGPRVGATPAIADSVYASSALRALVAAVANAGKDAPTSLRAYRVGVESEIALVVRTAAAREGAASATGGPDAARERVMQVEQVESTLAWQHDGAVEQHVVGYRARAITANVSALSYFHRPWVVPVLYGNRLQVLLGRGTARAPGDTGASRSDAEHDDVLLAIHPFANDRDAVYHFAGGDTVMVLQVGGRAVPIVRVLVEPRGTPPGRTLLFRGELDVDAARHQVVRMRGQFVVAGSSRSLFRRVLAASWQTVAFAELVNGEFDGRYWLPTEQRLEGQGRSPLAGEFRPIVRVVSRFRDYVLDTAAVHLGAGAEAPPSAHLPPARLTFAPHDSVTAFTGWRAEIGAATGDARATDFDDVAPDSWRPRGVPRLDWRAERVNDVLRYNRVEGAFTGAAATLRLRDAAPGLALGASGGWAWAEQTARGALWGRWARGPWTYGARAERALANTNDFRPLLDYEQSLMALLVTADDYDYIDRRSLTLSAGRTLPLPGAPSLRVEVGPGSDRGERTRVPYGLVHLDSAFRPNRPVTPGSYLRTAVALDLHPNVSGEFLEPGIGAGLWYERGDGALRWQRVEGRLTARHTRGPITYAGRLDGIALFTRQVLPQQLIEFGENEGLPGYAFKEFGGDRAGLARAAVAYELPYLRAPLRLGRWSGPLSGLYLPGISPSVALGVQAGWSGASAATTRTALALFGTRTDTLTGRPVLATRPTDGVRSTVNLTLRLFGGTLGLGVARPLDRISPNQGWRFVFGVGQPF